MTIRIERGAICRNAGRFKAIGALIFTLAGTPAVFSANTLVTPNASPEACSLFSFFNDTYGKKVISGQQDGWRGTNRFSFELDYIKKMTGKLPALIGMDLSGYTRPDSRAGTQHQIVEEATDWYRNRNGIVTLCWHWLDPIEHKAIYTKDTSFDLSRGVTEGTPEHAAILRDLDKIAAELKLLRDAHVPVLWRPLHEANGRWFWWGAQGPEPFKKLWRMMYERFTDYHKLNNLIWVFSPGAAIDLADWYPGDSYVDIIGPDHYPMNGNHDPAADIFNELVAFTHGIKLVALGENGPIPDPARMMSEKAGWLYFSTWSGSTLTGRNTKEQLAKDFNNPYVLNLADLPDLKNYPFQRVGKPMQLAFPASPGRVAINGLRRHPLAVAIQDNNGKTVRDGHYLVKLGLENSRNGKLSGTLQATSTNGLAIFPDVEINRAGETYRLRATASGLREAVSPVFAVGPGAGITYEWWTGNNAMRLADLSDSTLAPSGREIISKALEVPYRLATNYNARFTGWLLPPMSGSYQFWIESEGNSELWLGTDSNPESKIKIATLGGGTPYAKWPHTKEAASEPVKLEAGKRYFIEVLHAQANGPAHLSVRWLLPDGTGQRPIPGCYFDPSGNNSADTKRTQKSAYN
ncbi:MAG TPA: glycosyl hydrolase [Verrucomicrobiae bacterium]|nr:glycosyl hydrolase [Verrucomicrobiae bacterium]